VEQLLTGGGMTNETLENDERTNALGLFNTARSYWCSAEYLNGGDLGVTHPQAPVTFLFCHAIELYLKAYLRGIGKTVADLKKVGHRVSNLAKLSRTDGLVLAHEQSEILSHIDDADVALESRYIVTGFATRPTNHALSDLAKHLDIAVCDALVKLGQPVRHLQSPPHQQPLASSKPPPAQLDEDASRILVQLFKADDIDSRGLGGCPDCSISTSEW
jgi:hypothetical protein